MVKIIRLKCSVIVNQVSDTTNRKVRTRDIALTTESDAEKVAVYLRGQLKDGVSVVQLFNQIDRGVAYQIVQ